MTTVIMINTSVKDHDDDDDDNGVGDGVIHDCDGGDDGQEEEKDGWQS